MGTSTPELKHRRSGDKSNTGDHLGLLTPRYGHVHSPGFKHLDGVSLPPVRGGDSQYNTDTASGSGTQYPGQLGDNADSPTGKERQNGLSGPAASSKTSSAEIEFKICFQ